MRKATAIYHAPSGDNKVVEMCGVTFFDGQPVELNTYDHAHMISKLPNNQHFEIEIGEDDGVDILPPERSNSRDLKAGIKEAIDYDFEDDRRANLEGKPVAELRRIAADRGIDHDGMSKAQLRQVLS